LPQASILLKRTKGRYGKRNRRSLHYATLRSR
jgi:hypothetical protein